ncbi:MAG: Flp family type IVb pilin [Candidatus Uhrbacteria bacterium]|nr:Flp family type IVb pilin [Candidatus Uhrbacteria bacterium]
MSLSKWFKDDSGQAMSEYGLIIALIAVVAIGVIAIFGTKIKAAFDTAQKALP